MVYFLEITRARRARELRNNDAIKVKVAAQLQRKTQKQIIYEEFAQNGIVDKKAYERRRKQVLRASKRRERFHANQLLSDLDEISLVGFLRCHAKQKNPFKLHEIIEYVRTWKNFGDKWDGWRWVRGFMSRNNDLLRAAAAKETEAKRMDARSWQDIEDFIGITSAYEKKITLSAEQVANADETPNNVSKTNARAKFVVCAEDGRPGQAMPCKDSLITILPFFLANGRVLAVFHIFKASEDGKPMKVFIDPESGTKREKWPTYFMTTKCGFTDSTCWREIARIVGPLYSAVLGSRTGLLFLDQHGPHLDIESIKIFASYNVIVILFPPGVTHFMQPCDGVVFGEYKRVFAKLQNATRRKLQISDQARNYLNQICTKDAQKQSFTPAFIEKSFRDAGLWPWAPQTILKNAEKALPPRPKKTKTTTDQDLRKRAEELNLIVQQQNTPTIVAPKRVVIAKQRAMDSAQILLKAAQLEEAEAATAEEKKRKKEEKEALKKTKADEREKKKLERTQAQQQAKRKRETDFKNGSCALCSRRFGGGKSWWTCLACQQFRMCSNCLQDRGAKAKHEAQCREAENGVEVVADPGPKRRKR